MTLRADPNGRMCVGKYRGRANSYHAFMIRSQRFLTAAACFALLLGLALHTLVFFQPWSKCADDDSSAGCPLEGISVVVQASSIVSFSVGIALVALLVYRATKKSAGV